MKQGDQISIRSSIAWTGIYFCFLLATTAMNLFIWEPYLGKWAEWTNLIFLGASIGGFLFLLKERTGFQMRFFDGIELKNFALAIGAVILLLLLLNYFLDPILEDLFPLSEADYQNAVEPFLKSPVPGFIQICLLFPFIEEILIRGFVLGGTRKRYGWIIALLLSSFLFGLLHFNMLQTLSAFVAGITFGMLYLYTDSIFCCILAHIIYNAISFLLMF